MRSKIISIGVLLVGLSVPMPDASVGEEPSPEALSAETRKEVIGQMKRILQQTKITRLGERPVAAELVPEPVLNWDDLPRGHHYGTLWVWGAKGRPAAIIEMYTVNFARQIDQWPGNVLHSLAAEPLQVEADFAWDWAPRKPGFTPMPLNDVPAPAETKVARTLQMRALAKRFSGRQAWRGDRSELRLLPTPVWQYVSDEEGVLAGGLFAFSHGGTNPEVVLILEATRNRDGDRWQFGCVRLGHAEMTIRFDDRIVWSAPTYNEVNPEAPYYWIARP
jgi:hypothetical protein